MKFNFFLIFIVSAIYITNIEGRHQCQIKDHKYDQITFYAQKGVKLLNSIRNIDNLKNNEVRLKSTGDDSEAKLIQTGSDKDNEQKKDESKNEIKKDEKNNESKNDDKSKNESGSSSDSDDSSSSSSSSDSDDSSSSTESDDENKQLEGKIIHIFMFCNA